MANHPNRSKRNPSPARNPAASEIQEARAASGLTQKAFGELVYKSWRTVQEWEAGLRRMPPDTWELIRVKLKAGELLRRNRIARDDIENLGLRLPSDPPPGVES